MFDNRNYRIVDTRGQHQEQIPVEPTIPRLVLRLIEDRYRTPSRTKSTESRREARATTLPVNHLRPMLMIYPK